VCVYCVVAACRSYVVCALVWQHVIVMVCGILYFGVAACHCYGVCSVVWQHIIFMVCELWCGNLSYVWFVCCGVAACHGYGV